MKSIQSKLLMVFILALGFSSFNYAQDSLPFELSYEVDRIYPSLAMTKPQLKEVQTVMDLNPHYKPEWIKEYISMEISAVHQGVTKKEVGKNQLLTQAQKDLINKADIKSEISVLVKYMPNNNLKHNDLKEINFDLFVDAKNDAIYLGGKEKMKQYLKETAIDKISKEVYRQYHLTAVKFSVNEKGQVVDVSVEESSSDKTADKALSEAICNMPNWKPAEYANGTKVKQDFVLMVGDRTSCVRNLFNIRKKYTD